MKALVAAFTDEDAILRAAETVRERAYPLLDALTPYPVERLSRLVGASRSPGLRVPMAVAGFGSAALFFALEWWSAAAAYPINTGGRPLFSWPVFLLSPFEIGMLVAAFVGFAGFLLHCGLPRLSHSLFDVPGFERATQDRFFLLADPLDDAREPELRTLLFDAGAMTVSEVEA